MIFKFEGVLAERLKDLVEFIGSDENRVTVKKCTKEGDSHGMSVSFGVTDHVVTLVEILDFKNDGYTDDHKQLMSGAIKILDYVTHRQKAYAQAISEPSTVLIPVPLSVYIRVLHLLGIGPQLQADTPLINKYGDDVDHLDGVPAIFRKMDIG